MRTVILFLPIVVVLGSVASFNPRNQTVRLQRRNFPRGGNASTTIASHVVQQSTASFMTSLKESLTVWTLKDVVFTVAAVVSAATSTAAMIVEASILVNCVGWFCITLGISSAVMQKRLSELDSMRKLTNAMREEVSSLAEANTRLRKENSRLDANTKKLQKAESDLEAIALAQGIGIQELVQQVNQYKHIQQQVREDLKTQIKQTLLSIVMRSDLNQDYKLNESEVDILVTRLQAMPDVKFNEQAFRKAIQRLNGSILDFMNEHLTDDAKIAKHKIFLFSD